MTGNEPRYAGFWIRFAASLIDSIIVSIIILPIIFYIYGFDYFFDNRIFKGTWDVILQLVFPATAIILLWIYRSTTPGKDIAEITIVDATTLQPLNARQSIIRYLGYYISLFGLFLGFIAISFDKRKQGWHDKIAGTVVIYKTTKNPNPDFSPVG